MAEDEEHWAERRQRFDRCKIHGLHYDPRMTSGCVLCRKEGLDATPPQKPQLVVMLLALLGVAVILYRVFGPGALDADGAVDETETLPAAAAVEASRLLAEDYRSEIEAVDRALFEAAGADLEAMSDQILSALQRLIRRLGEASSPEGRKAAGTIEQLAAEIASVPFSLDLLQGFRSDWAVLRNRYFGTAVWFAKAAAAGTNTDRAAIITYRDVASDLTSLLDEGWSRARELSEPVAPNYVDPEDEARKNEEWRAFQAGWGLRIQVLKSSLPQRPGAGADSRILMAAQRLDHAFDRVSSLAASTGLPSEARINDAFDIVESAHQSFEDLVLR